MMMTILVMLLVLALCALVFCIGILVGWWYVHHVSPEAWEWVKAAAYASKDTGGDGP